MNAQKLETTMHKYQFIGEEDLREAEKIRTFK
jgi:hypothetical protein